MNLQGTAWFNRLRNVARYTSSLGPRRGLARVVRTLRTGGIAEFSRLARNLWINTCPRPVEGEPLRDRNDYAEWVRRFDTITPADVQAMRTDIAAWVNAPRISVVMPTYNPQEDWLVEAIESVRNQVYPHWELCIADDASTKPHVRAVLERFAAQDSRIRITFRPTNGHISATSNSALELATGEWMALLDHDDLLPCHALYWIAKAALQSPRARMVYSDEDKVDDQGERSGPYFKCDWNPDLFKGQNMFSHLGAFQTALVRQVGGFRLGLEGSQDYDLALRCIEHLGRDQVVHLPRVLYHWRVHEQSTAQSNDAKPYAHSAAERALNDHLERTGVRARALRTAFGYRVQYELPSPAPRVGVIVIGKAARALQHSGVAALLGSAYPELMVYVPGDASSVGGLAAHPRVRFFRPDGVDEGFAAAVSTLERDGCSVLCLVEAGAVPSGADWLDEMVSQCLRPEIGVVGPKLVDGHGRILSAGAALIQGPKPALLDLHAGFPVDAHGYGGRCQLAQACSVVRSNCIAIRMDVYRRAWQSPVAPHFDGGAELCRRVWDLGLEVLWTPHVQVRLPGKLNPLQLPQGWGTHNDVYNPNLHRGQADFSLGWPPLVTATGPRP